MCCKYFSKICLDFFLFLLNKLNLSFSAFSVESNNYTYAQLKEFCKFLGMFIYNYRNAGKELIIVETSVQFSNGLTLKSYSKIFGRKMAVISEL